MERVETKQGKSYTRGYIKGIITLLAMENDGIEEPRLRDLLREITGVRENRGIKKHLKDLEDEKIIFKKSEAGKSNKWYFNDSEFDFFEFFEKSKSFGFSLWFSRQEVWLKQVKSIFDIYFNRYTLGSDEAGAIEGNKLLNPELENILVEFFAIVEKLARDRIFSLEDLKRLEEEKRVKYSEISRKMADKFREMTDEFSNAVLSSSEIEKIKIEGLRLFLKMILCISPSAQEFILNLFDISGNDKDRLLHAYLKISQLEMCGTNIKCNISDFLVSFFGCIFLDESRYKEKDFLLSICAKICRNTISENFPMSTDGVESVSGILREIFGYLGKEE